MPRAGKNNPVGLPGVVVPDRGAKSNLTDAVALTLLQNFDIANI